MGDRLIINVKDEKETYAIGYFHYGAVVERMVGLVACMIDAFPENIAPQNEYEKYELAIDLLEATGARIPSYELKRWEKWNFVDENEKLIHKKKREAASKDGNKQQKKGVILISEIGKEDFYGFQEYSVFIDITDRTVDLGVRVVNREKLLEIIDGYEYSEMFNDPDFLPELDVTEEELHALSFERFLKLGERLIQITEHGLKSYAKVKDEDKFIPIYTDGWAMPLRREGYIDGIMPFEIGRMLYYGDADEFAKAHSEKYQHSIKLGQKLYHCYQRRQMDCYNLIEVLKGIECDDKTIKDILEKQFDMNYMEADSAIQNIEETMSVIHQKKYRFARIKARELYRHGVKAYKIEELVSCKFRIPEHDVFEMLQEIEMFDRTEEGAEKIENIIMALDMLFSDDSDEQSKKQAIDKYSLTEQEIDSFENKKIKVYFP